MLANIIQDAVRDLQDGCHRVSLKEGRVVVEKEVVWHGCTRTEVAVITIDEVETERRRIG